MPKGYSLQTKISMMPREREKEYEEDVLFAVGRESISAMVADVGYATSFLTKNQTTHQQRRRRRRKR